MLVKGASDLTIIYHFSSESNMYIYKISIIT